MVRPVRREDPPGAFAETPQSLRSSEPETGVVTGLPLRPPSEPTTSGTFGPAPELGERIGESGRFEVVGRLGTGGMGHVFQAFDSHLDRTVAIKFILPGHGLPVEQLITLLRREAKVTAKLSHENIVAIFDLDAHNASPFLVMELLDGQSLDALMRRSRLLPLRATQILSQVARGLAHAHANGIVHRDLKPSNVFILRDGRAKILDFGISQFERPLAAQAPGEAGLTITGVGTPPFMAPEQWRGDPQDGRVDIWAAGVMYYQLLTGQLPYTVQDLLRFRSEVRVRTVAPSVRLIEPSLPEEVDRLVATALSEEPEGRFQTARELGDALAEAERVLNDARYGSGARGPSSRQIERRPLTLLACRLESAAALDLDEAIEADEWFFGTCARVVSECDGRAGTPIGGMLFCCFGYPLVRETDAPDAVRAALQIVQALRAPRPSGAATVDFRIGIHSGVVGLPGAAGPESFPAMQGDVPNVAARIAMHGPLNAAVMSGATLTLTGGLFVTEAMEDATTTPVGSGSAGVYRVLHEIEAGRRWGHGAAGLATPFVGRERELGAAWQVWEQAREGRGQALLISGEAGIGKSRLIEALRDRVIDDEGLHLSCQGRAHFRSTALRPIVELLARTVGLAREDTPEARLHKLERHLSALGVPLPDTVPLLASLLSIPLEQNYAPLTLTPEQQKVRTIEAVTSLLLATSSQRPVLFIVEDLHWVDYSTIELLGALVDLVPAARLLMVLTCRPEFRVPWSARRHLHVVKLDRLPSNAMASIVTQLAGAVRLPDEVIERLVATADGVPLFGEELTRMVAESWRPDETSSQADSFAVPRTLHELLLARLDRLRPPGKAVAQIAAVLGRDFAYPVIRDVSSLDEMSLEQGLDVLVDAGLLQLQRGSPSSSYRFKHALIQHAAYQSLVKSERQAHHGRAAEVLANLFPETAESEPELFAHHHAEAGHAAEAIAFWQKAGQQATERSALKEAIVHYTRALEALKTLPEGVDRDRRELALLLALGSPLMSVHGYAHPDVERTYARARDLADAAGGQVDLFPAMQGLWQFYFVRGMLPTSRALGATLLEIANAGGSSTFRLLAHRAYASSAFLQGDFEACRVHTRAGFELYDRREHGALAYRTGHDPGVAHGVYQAWTLWMLGSPDQCLRTVLQMVDLARELSHPLTMAYALCFAALMRNHRGEHGDARTLAIEALGITTEHKFSLWEAWGRMQLGWALAGLGDHEDGIPRMENGLAMWKSTGARVGFTFFPVTLAEMCLRSARLGDAAALLAEALPMVEANDERFYEAELCRLQGELALRTTAGAEAEAEAHFARGLELARRQHARSWELRLAMSLARLWTAGGRSSQAMELVERTLKTFTEGYDTADVQAASTQLEALRGSRVPGANQYDRTDEVQG